MGLKDRLGSLQGTVERLRQQAEALATQAQAGYAEAVARLDDFQARQRLGALLGELGRLTYLESHQRAPEDANERRAALLGELEALEARLGSIAPTAAKRDARASEARDAQGAGDADEGRQADGQTSSSVSRDAGSVPHEAYGSPPEEVD